VNVPDFTGAPCQADPELWYSDNPNSYYRAWPVDEPLKTLHTIESKALAIPVEGRDGKQPRSMSDALRTQTTRLETALVTPPFVAELRGGGSTARRASDPLSTVTASGTHHGLITSYYGNSQGATPVSEALSTVTTVDRHALLTPGDIEAAQAQVDDVLFRMLEPAECKGAMAFPSEYVILGNRREQVRMVGNAVTPPAARDLVAAVAASLGVVA